MAMFVSLNMDVATMVSVDMDVVSVDVPLVNGWSPWPCTGHVRDCTHFDFKEPIRLERIVKSWIGLCMIMIYDPEG